MSEGLLCEVKRKTHGMIGGQIKVLTNEQLKMIDEAAKDVLWRTGVLMPNKEAQVKAMFEIGKAEIAGAVTKVLSSGGPLPRQNARRNSGTSGGKRMKIRFETSISSGYCS
jgi:hypothetical protein